MALAFLVAVGVLLSSGCSESPSSAPSEASLPQPASRQNAEKAPDAVEQAIALVHEKLRNAPGRVGILAEKRIYSLFDEELIIRDFFQDRRDGFFLDIGCAWPAMANNTMYLEKHLGWTGIGVDALEEYGSAWKKKRPKSRFFSYLVTDHSNVKETFYRSPDTGLSSTDRAAASGGLFGAKLEPVAVQIETITLNDLLDRENVTKVDLLALDIEGNEPKALAGFDIDRFRPELAIVEHMTRAGSPDPVLDYFEAHGYELIEKYQAFDTVNRYFRRRVQEP